MNKKYKTGLMRFSGIKACIQIFISYHVENFEVIIDSQSWSVYEGWDYNEFTGTQPVGPYKFYTMACRAGERLNFLAKQKRVTTQMIHEETDRLLYGARCEQAKLKWAADKKAFKQDFMELLKKYGMNMKVDENEIGEWDTYTLTTVELERKWNAEGDRMYDDLIEIITDPD